MSQSNERKRFMAIYGVGSKWNDEELAPTFFNEKTFTLGWDEENAEDLYSFLASLKAGDILYLKANRPGSRVIRVKGIGFIRESFISSFCGKKEDISDYQSFSLPVVWIVQKEFLINIPQSVGRLTNIRAATAYEEYLPLVQKIIIEKILEKINIVSSKTIFDSI